ncbi:XrtY-associated glycosyltransferase XYAG1 [Pedobacter duraquae]|uniref:Glycosyltransferase involved in cell wall biosynthesis n=1 Tax=Pedobacter duraquae TaxID=425511 RepID=A0A4R6IM58_9SPHI|nr:glycosyltransferase [Pedobacter duraquae]TDO23161.1 glycosyltransferase involved in cell wall biosynthesis [Pedobacter duraquae]
MKNIQISPSYKPAYYYGGPTMSVSKLCEELVKAETPVTVLTTTANGAAELPAGSRIIDGVPVHYHPRMTGDPTHFSPSLLKTLDRTLKLSRSHQTIVHIHSWWNLVTIFSCWIAKRRKVAVLLSPRGMLTTYTLGNRNTGMKHIIHSLLGKSLLKYSHIHATSAKEKQDLLKIIKPKSITVIPNFVRFPQEPQAARSVADGALQLLFLSRIEEKKGLDILFKALSQVNFEWQLAIAGSGTASYVDNLKHIASELNIGQFISWKGHITDEDKFSVMENHDLLVLPSHNENFANVVIESLAVGTPVLLSDRVGLSEYIIEQQLGWISKLNPKEFAHTLQQIHADKSQLDKIRSRAPAIIRRDFNEIKIVDQYIDLYNRILTNG